LRSLGDDDAADDAFISPSVDIEILKCRGHLDRRRPTRLRWMRSSCAAPPDVLIA